jgi:predicted class III extradiol MEMO1 family dioxygenase
MSISSPTPIDDTSVWTSLKQAIVASSGFQHWATQLSTLEQSNLSLDDRVQRYLRETLETLAY